MAAAAISPLQKRDVELRAIDALAPYAANARTHSPEQVAQIAASMREFGWTNPVLIDEAGGIIAGHGRVMAARELGASHVPCIVIAGLSAAQRRALVIADNKLALNAGWDFGILASELAALDDGAFDMALTGFDAGEIERIACWGGESAPPPGPAPSLADRFMVPPFSVLNAREGWWQERKRAWIAAGIASELGRGENALKLSDAMRGIAGGMTYDEVKRARRARAFAKHGSVDRPGIDQVSRRMLEQSGGTSIFDPVLCEIAYRWFCPPAGRVLDPFAGGSVRGIVAAMCGRRYTGIDLSATQVEENRRQAQIVLATGAGAEWIVGDSATAVQAVDGAPFDMIFSCPPYADLERYSDDPADLSAMEWKDFARTYRAIIAASAARLADDRFACFVVGEVRDRRSRSNGYRGIVPLTIAAFEDAGLAFYNEAILVTAVGTLALRAAGAFVASRKLGKTHQNVLVFVKGDPVAAVGACGAVDVPGELFDAVAAHEGSAAGVFEPVQIAA